KPGDYLPPHEEPNEEYPLVFSTGRTVYHFHTRTKTGRARQLQAAAPDVWVEMSAADATELGVEEGDVVEVSSPRGHLIAKARVSGIEPGIVFAPFHYGYWDETDENGFDRAANELTITQWDPTSKQPIFKVAAVRVKKVAPSEGVPAPAPTTGASEAAPNGGSLPPLTEGGPDAQATSTFAHVPGKDGSS